MNMHYAMPKEEEAFIAWANTSTSLVKVLHNTMHPNFDVGPKQSNW